MKKKTKILIAVACALLVIPVANKVRPSNYEVVTQAATTMRVKVNGSLNVRSGPGTGYRKLGSLSNGAKISVTGGVYPGGVGIGKGWWEINYKGKTGYVHQQYVQW